MTDGCIECLKSLAGQCPSAPVSYRHRYHYRRNIFECILLNRVIDGIGISHPLERLANGPVDLCSEKPAAAGLGGAHGVGGGQWSQQPVQPIVGNCRKGGFDIEGIEAGLYEQYVCSSADQSLRLLTVCLIHPVERVRPE